MKNRAFAILFALLALAALTFVACTSDEPTGDTTPDTTVTTNAPTEESTEESTNVPTEEVTTEEVTTEEVTTEEVTTETPTEEVTEPEKETLAVDLEKVTISSSIDLFENHFTTADKESCVDDLKDMFGNPAIADGVKIPLVYQGAINLGTIDLSKYSKVTITYATSAAPGTVADYETTQKRAMLTSADTKGLLSPASDSDIVAHAIYHIPATTWELTTVEIDLKDVTYNGALFLTFDFTSGVNLYHAVTSVVFEG